MIDRVPLRLRGLPLLDTNVFIRLLTGDVPERKERARMLFKQIEARKMTVLVPSNVISECIHVLGSARSYHLPKEEIVSLLRPLLRLPYLKLMNRQVVLRALDFYLRTNLGYEDSYLLASMERYGAKTIYSYDEGFDRIQGITRKEP